MNIDVDELAIAILGPQDGSTKPDPEIRSRRILETLESLYAPARGRDDGYGLPEIRYFRSQFASRYLDKFLDLLMEGGDVELFTLADDVLSNGYFIRWILQAPDAKIHRLFTAAINHLHKTSPNVFKGNLFDELTKTGRLLESTSLQVDTTIVIKKLLNTTLLFVPNRSLDFRSSLTSVLSRSLHIIAAQSELIISHGQPRSDLKEILQVFSRNGLDPLLSYIARPSGTSLDAGKEFIARVKGIPWLICEVCKGSRKGEAMKACGRCMAVRYCSEDHQRVHWKEHKKRCFLVEWGPLDL